MLQRINLTLGPVDTGKGGTAAALSDTGPNVWGKVVGVQLTSLVQGTAAGPDTGCHINLGLYQDLTDTGTGYLFYAGDNAGDAGEFPTAVPQAAAPFTPVQQLRDKTGSHDTGAANVYAFGERIRGVLSNCNDTGYFRVYVYLEK